MEVMCGDNRFEIIARAKKALLEGANIDMCPDEMAVIDNILFRCWQMGWLDRYDTADTPQTNVPRCSVNGTPYDECGFCEYFNCDTNRCEADTPQTEREGE